MPRKKEFDEEFENHSGDHYDNVSDRLASRGIIKNTHGQVKPYEDYDQEPEWNPY